MTNLEQALEAVRGGMSANAASIEYEVPRTTLRRHIKRSSNDDGYLVTGRSTLVDADGNTKLEWIKTSLDQERLRELREAALEGMQGKVTPQAPIPPPTAVKDALCNLYVITDYHYGMLEKGIEGQEWDLDIAEKTLSGCFSTMMNAAPPAKIGIVCNLGDFMHADNLQGTTPAHGHILEITGRYKDVVKSAVRALRRVIADALTKHEQIHVIMAEGNHDPVSSIYLTTLFQALYEEEPRITIDDSALPFYCYQHGSTMLAFHHGHKKKFGSLTAFFAAQFPKVWGDTIYRYGHTGHRHHLESKEDMGIEITQHKTLSPRDQYAQRHGFHSTRGALCITYHKKNGFAASNIVTPEMLEE